MLLLLYYGSGDAALDTTPNDFEVSLSFNIAGRISNAPLDNDPSW